MRPMFLASSALPLVLLGCPAQDTSISDTDSGAGYHETGVVDETGETAETGDTGVIDTADTAETGDTDTSVEVGLANLEAWPAAMIVNPGATYVVRVVATQKSGDREVYGSASFAADDAAIATVDGAGVVTAVGAGSTTIRVTAEGLEADVTIEVRAALEAKITVVNGTTGAPIAGATVHNDTVDVVTDAAGLATVPVPSGDPATFTAWLNNDYFAVSVLDTVSRELTLTLKVSDDQDPTAELHGAVDFAGIGDAGLGEEVFGLASGSVQGDLALFEVDDLLAPNRTLNYHGVEAAVPSNLFVENYLDDYYAQVWPGPVAAWGLGGPVAISELAAGLNGTGDAMGLIIDHLPTMTWGVTTGITAVAGADADGPLAPSISFSDSVHVALPSLSAGFEGTEEELVCTFDGTSDGWVLTGLGLGAGVVDIAKVPDGSVPGATSRAAYVLAQVGGLGSGSGVAVSVAPDDGGTVTFPELQDVPTITSWVPGDRTLDFTVDSAATLVRVVFADEHGRKHELWTDSSWSGIVDKQNPEFQRGLADVTVESYEVFDGNFEQWVSTGGLDPAGLGVSTVSRNTLSL